MLETIAGQPRPATLAKYVALCSTTYDQILRIQRVTQSRQNMGSPPPPTTLSLRQSDYSMDWEYTQISAARSGKFSRPNQPAKPTKRAPLTAYQLEVAKWRDHCRKNKLCYGCGSPDHWGCKRKEKPQFWQFPLSSGQPPQPRTSAPPGPPRAPLQAPHPNSPPIAPWPNNYSSRNQAYRPPQSGYSAGLAKAPVRPPVKAAAVTQDTYAAQEYDTSPRVEELADEYDSYSYEESDNQGKE